MEDSLAPFWDSGGAYSGVWAFAEPAVQNLGCKIPDVIYGFEDFNEEKGSVYDL